MKDRKTVTIKGVIWTILSANERCTTVSGRHFFASRCNSKSPWYLCEHDCDITASETGAREVGYLPFRLKTDYLSLSVIDITRNAMDLPRRPANDRQPLAAIVQDAPIFYLLRIGAIKSLAAKPADIMPKFIQFAGRASRILRVNTGTITDELKGI